MTLNMKIISLSIIISLVVSYTEGMLYRSTSFSYTAAILRKSSFLTSGALISDKWVLTDANELFALREVKRELKVRLGSINYKEGGLLIPVKYIEIHPNFNDATPEYDIALVQLAETVRNTAFVHPIKLLKRVQNVVTTHFIVTYWEVPVSKSQSIEDIRSWNQIENSRMLQSSQLHPGDSTNCSRNLRILGIRYPGNLMCLDSPVMGDPCMRETWRGAPVVFNRVLWGIMSSWMPNQCDVETSILVNSVSSPEIHLWIKSTLQ